MKHYKSGAGMWNLDSDPLVINCTFSLNTAPVDGGGIWNDNQFGSSDPVVTNCIFWGNTDSGGMDESAQIHDAAPSASTVNDSDVQGGWTGAGSGNINADPLFVDADGADNTVGTEDDNLRLQLGSPCIEDGTNSVVTESTDLDGNPRIVDFDSDSVPTVDMGAYEVQIDCNGPVGDGDGDGVPNASDNCPCYPNPSQEYAAADFDEDCDVDGIDFSSFSSCFNKAGNPPRSLGCPGWGL